MDPKRVQDIFFKGDFLESPSPGRPTIGQNAEIKGYYFGVVIFNVKPHKTLKLALDTIDSR